MIACYLKLYEEGEVEHINGPTHPCPGTHIGSLSKVEYTVACSALIQVGAHARCMMACIP